MATDNIMFANSLDPDQAQHVKYCLQLYHVPFIPDPMEAHLQMTGALHTNSVSGSIA